MRVAPVVSTHAAVRAARAYTLAVRKVVGPSRVELPTSRLSGVRSNQLSYGPTPQTQAALALDER